jgi:uncharacterized protein YdgA (DUF945 family)
MKRGLAAAAVALAAVVLGLPWVLGAQFQRVYETALARMQEQGMRVIDSRYRRGWLSSETSVRIRLPRAVGQSLGFGPIPLRIESRIVHGPRGFGSTLLPPAAALIESRVELLFPGLELPPLLLKTRVELDGSGTSEIRTPAISHQTESADLQIQEGRGELRFAAGFADVEGHFDLPSLSLSIPEGRILGRLSVDGQGLTPQILERPGAWLEHLAGEGELSVPRPLLLRLLEGWQRSRLLETAQWRGQETPRPSEMLDTEIATTARERLDVLVRQGWLAEEAKGLTTTVMLADALLTVNGKTIPVGTVTMP